VEDHLLINEGILLITSSQKYFLILQGCYIFVSEIIVLKQQAISPESPVRERQI